MGFSAPLLIHYNIRKKNKYEFYRILYSKKFGGWNTEFGKTTRTKEIITGFLNDDRIA